MKRILLFSVLSLICIFCMGQGGTTKVPDIQKFVMIYGENVNLYKQPNTQSALLRAKVRNASDLEQINFSWTKMQGYSAFHLPSGKIVAVLKEENGWYLIYINHNTEAYVRADKCEHAEPYYFYGSNYNLDRKGKPERFGVGLLWSDIGNESIMNNFRSAISYRFWIDTISVYYNAATYKHEMVTQPRTYNVRKFIVAAPGKKLHIRKEPNLAAPELVFYRNPNSGIGGVRGEGHQWDKKGLNRAWVKKNTPSALAVIGETNNWYQVYVCLADNMLDADYVQFIGYVLKSDCTEAQARPITGKFIKEKGVTIANDFFDAETITTSQHGQLLLTAGTYIWGGGQHIKMARMKGNIALVCAKISYYIEDEESYQLTFAYRDAGENEEREVNITGQQYCKKFPSYESTALQINLSKASQPVYNAFADLLSTDNYTLAYVNVNDQYLLELDLIYNGRPVVFDLE